METSTFMPFVNIDWTVIFMLANTGILFAIVSKLLFKPVKKMIDQREQEVASIYTQAEETRTKADCLMSEYTIKIKDAKNEANDIVAQAHKKATLHAEDIVKEANQKASTLMNKAQQDIELEKKKALNEVKDEISDIAMMIASKVVEKDITKQDHEKLIAQFIDGVGDVI